MKNSTERIIPRAGVKDLWNAALCEGAEWTELDNPRVKSTATLLPTSAISWHEAKRLHNKMLKEGKPDYRIGAFVHCYIDDPKFDGEREGIWKRPEKFYEVVSHFEGMLGIDFSTNADFPEPVKRFQFHRMRTMEYGANVRGLALVPNARWGTEETWPYCFDGLPEGKPLSVGTVASGLRELENRPVFEAGLRLLVKQKHPSALVVVGSANYSVFDELRDQGVKIVQIDGDTSRHFGSKEAHDVEAS